MIHVLIWPDRFIERLRYELFGTIPSISGDQVRYGPSGIEIVQSDINSCRFIPAEQIYQVYWDGGYKEALEMVRTEANQNAAIQLKSLVPDEEEGSMPYPHNFSDTQLYQ